jgi:hypothetical protein
LFDDTPPEAPSGEPVKDTEPAASIGLQSPPEIGSSLQPGALNSTSGISLSSLGGNDDLVGTSSWLGPDQGHPEMPAVESTGTIEPNMLQEPSRSSLEEAFGIQQPVQTSTYTQDAATTQFEEMTIAYLWKVAEAREHRPAVLERASQLGLGRRASRKLISFLNGGAKLTVSEYRRIMDVAQSRKSGWSSHGFMEIDDAELINRIVEAKSRGEDYILQMLRDEGGIRALPRLPLAAPHKNTHPTCEAKLWRIQASINSLM